MFPSESGVVRASRAEPSSRANKKCAVAEKRDRSLFSASEGTNRTRARACRAKRALKPCAHLRSPSLRCLENLYSARAVGWRARSADGRSRETAQKAFRNLRDSRSSDSCRPKLTPKERQTGSYFPGARERGLTPVLILSTASPSRRHGYAAREQRPLGVAAPRSRSYGRACARSWSQRRGAFPPRTESLGVTVTDLFPLQRLRGDVFA